VNVKVIIDRRVLFVKACEEVVDVEKKPTTGDSTEISHELLA